MSRKLIIVEHSVILGLFFISEPDNPNFEELFKFDEKSKMVNLFSSYTDAVKWIEDNIPEKKEIQITLTYN